MHAVVLTATLPYQVYQDERDYPSRVHVTRALDGPLANLLLGSIMLVGYLGMGGGAPPGFWRCSIRCLRS